MKLNIGENIRMLRRERGITQEQLAEAICVSFQAVSKWENGITMPDITLLPVLAAYFGVTTDRLLSFDMKEMEEDIGRIADEAFAYRESDPERSRAILEAGLEKYPDNDVLLNNMLYVMNYTEKPEDTIALASRLIARTDVSEIKYDALRFMAYAYNARGDKKSAVAAMEQVPELYFTKLSEMAFIAEGRQKSDAAEKQMWISFETLIQMMWKLAECRETEGDIEGAVLKVRQALGMIDVLKNEEKIDNFDTYVNFFMKQLERMEE